MPTDRDVFFESLYRAYFDKLKAIAYSKVENISVAEELAQETFLVALNDYETFSRHEQPFAYLKVALKFKIREYERDIRRYRRLFLSLDHELMAQVKAPSTSSLISEPGILETVREILTDDEWYLLWNFAMKGDSHRQIAASLGITVSASHKRLERIRKKLEPVLPVH